MPQKKIALYVEGQTEQVLLNHLIKTWWGFTGIKIENIKICGDRGSKCKVGDYSPDVTVEPDNFFLIIDVDGEGSLASSIAKRANRQHEQAYEIIGLRDLYAQDYEKRSSNRVEEVCHEILGNIKKALKIMKCTWPEKIDIFFSIMETEAWLLAFSNALAKWAKNLNHPTPTDIESIARPSVVIDQIGKNAGRGHHKSYNGIVSFVSPITREDIVEVYESNRVPSFSRFWKKILCSTNRKAL
jgi:hypothetical protein